MVPKEGRILRVENEVVKLNLGVLLEIGVPDVVKEYVPQSVHLEEVSLYAIRSG